MPKTIAENQKKNAQSIKAEQSHKDFVFQAENDLSTAARAAANPLQANPSALKALNHLAGNRATHALIQTKLRVGAVDDAYEREADRKAEEVLSSGEMESKTGGDLLQLKTAGTPGSGVGSDFEKRLRDESQGGSRLPAGLRSQMQAKFNTDFGSVRIHQGSGAEKLNEAVSAKAFTHGNHIFFNAGQYQPNTSEGKRLIAHELTHVVQQNGTTALGIQRLTPAEIKQRKEYYSSEYAVEKGLEYAEHEGVGLGMAGIDAAGTITGLAANDVEGQQNKHDKRAGDASSGIGIISSTANIALGGAGLAKSGMTYHRGRMLSELGDKKSTVGMLGRRLRRRGRMGMAQSMLGIAGGVSGVTSGALGLSGKDKASSAMGGVTSAIGAVSSGLDITAASYSIHNARRKVAAAKGFATADREITDPSDATKKTKQRNSAATQAIASQVMQSQGFGRKGMGLTSKVLGGMSSIFGMAQGFGKLTGVKGDAVGGVGFALSFGGALLGGIGSLMAKRGDRKALEQTKNELAVLTSKIDTLKSEIDDLTTSISNLDVSIKAQETLRDTHQSDLDSLKKTDPNNKSALSTQESKVNLAKHKIRELKNERKEKEGLLNMKTDELKDKQAELKNLELKTDPVKAAGYIVDNLTGQDPDESLVAFVKDVLRIDDPVKFATEDPELAKQIIREKINKKG
jgi:hypothetical protein